MLDTVVISGDDVCCSVMFGTLVGVFVFSVMGSELQGYSLISKKRLIGPQFPLHVCLTIAL